MALSMRINPILRSTGPSGFNPSDAFPFSSMALRLMLACENPQPQPISAGSRFFNPSSIAASILSVTIRVYSRSHSCVYRSPIKASGNPGGPTSGAEWVWVTVHQIFSIGIPKRFWISCATRSYSAGDTRHISDEIKQNVSVPSFRRMTL